MPSGAASSPTSYGLSRIPTLAKPKPAVSEFDIEQPSTHTSSPRTPSTAGEFELVCICGGDAIRTASAGGSGATGTERAGGDATGTERAAATRRGRRGRC
ncbi:unnamed protein product [Urochloa humidicola]